MINVPSLLLSLILTDAVLAASLWIAVGPSSRRGVADWAGALVLQALCFILFALRVPGASVESELASIVAVNVCAAGAYSLQASAILEFYGRRLAPIWKVAPALGVGLVYL